MSRVEYPNRDALRKAHDIYLDAIYPFVNKCLDKFQDKTANELIKNELGLAAHDNIAEKIEISDIAHLVRTYWYDYFQDQFEAIDRHYEARSAIGLIVEGRNRASHRPWDLDPEFTRTQLFLIAEVLGKISMSDAQSEVEDIRDRLFEDTTEHLVTIAVEDEKAKYEKSIAAVEKRLAAEEANNKKLEKKVTDNAAKLNKKTKELEELAGKFLNIKKQKDDYKNRYTSKSKELTKAKERLKDAQNEAKEIEAERDTSVERFATVSNELTSTQVEKNAVVGHLAAAKNFIDIVSNQLVYPPIETDSTVRILDRRGVEKKNYLLNLLEQKQPTVIYVQSEEKIDQLLEFVGTEKAEVIGKHNEQTSEAEEAEILEKLEKGELIAVVSDTIFSSLTSASCVEHFVFCHLVPGLDKFFKQCEPAFTGEKNAYLHFIYNSDQDIEGLTQRYPDREVLVKMYRELKKLAGANGDLIKAENAYSELNIKKPSIETGIAIFVELQLLEQNGESIKLLQGVNADLNKSTIHLRGEKLKKETADFQTFQLEHPIEQIWEALLKELDIDNEQILSPSSVNQARAVQDAEANSEVVEKGSEKKPEINEVKHSEFWQPIRDGEFGELFTGKPVPISNEGWITKTTRNIGIWLHITNQRCYVQIYFHGTNVSERREKIMTLFPKSEYAYTYRDSPKETKVQFPVLDKGKNDRDDWNEIRKKLVAIGTDIYNKIDESDL